MVILRLSGYSRSGVLVTCLTERKVFNPFKFSEYHTATNGNNPGGFGYFDKYPALVLHYSGGCAAAFFCTTHRGKYYSTSRYVYSVLKKVPEYRYPLYRSTGIGFKKLLLSIVFTILKKSYF
jgi:hypothetical protein